MLLCSFFAQNRTTISHGVGQCFIWRPRVYMLRNSFIYDTTSPGFPMWLLDV